MAWEKGDRFFWYQYPDFFVIDIGYGSFKKNAYYFLGVASIKKHWLLLNGFSKTK